MATEDSLSPNIILYPDWQNEYAAALVELDREKLPQRVAAKIASRPSNRVTTSLPIFNLPSISVSYTAYSQFKRSFHCE